MDAFDEYFTEDRVPQLRRSAVLFLDILGTSARRDPAQMQEHLVLTRDALAAARKQNDSERGSNELRVSSWFSDNLALAYPAEGDDLDPDAADQYRSDAIDLLIMDAALHQLTLAWRGIFVRGGIELGPFFAEKNFIQGEALNAAVKLEKAADYPRVILGDEAQRQLRARTPSDRFDRDLLVDPAGIVFVDHLAYVQFMSPEPSHDSASPGTVARPTMHVADREQRQARLSARSSRAS